MHSVVLNSLTFFTPLGYIIMALGAAIEGDAFIFASAFLVYRGIFDPLTTFLVLYMSVTIGDILWYRIGGRSAQSSKKIARFVHRAAPYVDRHLQKRLGMTLFVTKFMYGVHHAVTMRAGALKIDMTRFVRYDMLASFFWILIVGGLGFLTGSALPLFRHSLRYTEVGLTFGLVLFFMVEYIVRQIANRALPITDDANKK